jgi:ribose-phosphate pyrophosphokinase
MIVFAAMSYYYNLVDLLCANSSLYTAGQSEIERFTDGEIHVRVLSNVANEACIIIGSAAPPDNQLLSLLVLAEALKRNGARHVRALLPYLGYARQDSAKFGEGGGIALIGAVLRTAGVDEIITIDVHSEKDEQLIGLPLNSISPAPLFAPALAVKGWANAKIIAPDEGAVRRAQAFAQNLGNVNPVTYMVKRRVDGIVHLDIVGDVSAKVIIVDDIIDSGHTLLSACKLLRQKGAHEIAIAVTHGLFYSADWEQLFDLGVKTLLISDSYPRAAAQKDHRLVIKSIQPLLSDYFMNIKAEELSHEIAVA